MHGSIRSPFFRPRLPVLVVMLLVQAGLAASAVATTIHDEALDGELSGTAGSPTVLATALGSNVVIGQVGGASCCNPSDPTGRDVFTITIAPGQILSQVVLQLYGEPAQNSYLAVEAGPVITSFESAAALLGSALVGSLPGATQGDDLLDDLGAALIDGFPVGGAGFAPPLGPGQYTFWFQERDPDLVPYALDFVIVPEPSTALLVGLGLGALTRRRRR